MYGFQLRSGSGSESGFSPEDALSWGFPQPPFADLYFFVFDIFPVFHIFGVLVIFLIFSRYDNFFNYEFHISEIACNLFLITTPTVATKCDKF